MVNPIPGGPSEKLGIHAGDRIVTIENINVAGIKIKTTDVRKKLLGNKGTLVKVGIKRRGVREILDFTITRDKIPLFSLDAAYMVDDKTGYIKLNRFSATTMTEFHEALTKLKTQGIENLILDLQGNGGGYLNTAIDLADQFLDDKKMIVFTQGRNDPRQEHFATPAGDFENGKLIVLIDEGSASASEIVTGAIQDWDRGIVIGRRSFAKGLVQRQYQLPDESEIRLTIARYYTPSGRCIQKPYDKGVKDYHNDFIHRLNKGELTQQDSIKLPDSLKYHTMIKKRTVYGGGGIMPDIFVPLDTSAITDYYRDLIRKGVINRFALNYTDLNRQELKSKYPEYEKFAKDFNVTDKMFEDILKSGDDEKIKRNNDQIATSKELIRLQIKALIARDIFENGKFYQVINDLNPAYKKAVEVMKSKSAYRKILD
ncbi:MAG: S41 family peptidase [Bacteroidia bacterium]|nr:S41 family peptidase [Bacteroidia bacterium]